MPENNVIVIVYTTLYRKGGHQFPVVAQTLAKEKKAGGFAGGIITQAVESKREVLHIFDELKQQGKFIKEFHFVGHSGMYGPMFGTVKFPEQFSPYEWETTEIPFAENASAYFHCCRSARWFAPFFARTFNVRAHGFFWYTTFSKSKTKYKYVGDSANGDLYTVGCKGRKSHGLSASVKKFAGMMAAEEMKSFAPEPPSGDISYNHVAELYDAAFQDIRVRKDEWKWINEHLPTSKEISILDIGCGNGALLNALSDRINLGSGVDESAGMIAQAKKRNVEIEKLDFSVIDGPVLPFANAQFDVVVSMMSFRYLDWDPLLSEVKRVTKPGGKFLILDMVTVPVSVKEYPKLLADKLRTMFGQKKNKEFNANLAKLVSHPDWKKMLEYNPIRSEHEMKWYLESRFPGQKIEIINLGWNARLVAFDSGAVEKGVEVKMSYP
jgi:ubiquinone/menaquinone biosynthesis C-methylase UbiE